MVRLRVRPAWMCCLTTWISIPTWYDWEVQLQVAGPRAARSFQFQHGTIESTGLVCWTRTNTDISIPTWYDWECSRIPYPCCNFPISIPTWYDWERSGWSSTTLNLAYFNSNMVRLRAQALDFLHQCPAIFQFQHGTIESWFDDDVLYCAWYISIPTWYDWESLAKPTSPSLSRISIPTWYDWERRCFRP